MDGELYDNDLVICTLLPKFLTLLGELHPMADEFLDPEVESGETQSVIEL